MIIFGTRGMTSNAASGDFHCPECSPVFKAKMNYVHKKVRRFFTLYFIPLIPLDLHGEYIECQRCRGTYKLGILDYDPDKENAEFEAEYHRTIKLVMIQMMLADGVIDDEEIDAIRNIYSHLTGKEITVGEIRADSASLQASKQDICTMLKGMAGSLNDNGKAMVVRAAFMVATADGEFHDDEKILISSLGRAMSMSGNELKAIISSMLEE